MKQKLLFLLIPFLLIASTNDRALYIKKYKNESKTALVIGNSNYKYFSKLKNAKNDAQDMKELLESKGFKVYYLENASLRDMKRTLREFAYDIKNSGVGMIYYAGHGVEVDGKNYLIPVNADILAKDEVEYEALAVNLLIDKMENARNRLNILVLDACRNDPFSRSGSGGLAAINNAKGMYVAYATAPGKVASDGSGSNGLFTKHLISEIKKPQKLEEVFKNTRVSVMKESNDKQLPWTSSSIMGNFYFTVPNEKTSITTKQASKEDALWRLVKEENSKEYYELFISKYPNSIYTDIAKIKIKNLKETILSQSITKSENDTKGKFKIAILPSYVEFREKDAISHNLISCSLVTDNIRKAFFNNNSDTELTMDYCDTTSNNKFFKTEDIETIWYQKNWYSSVSVNKEKAIPLLKKYNLDYAFAFKIKYHVHPGNTEFFEVFIIDIKNNKLYYSEKIAPHGSEFDTIVQKLFNSVKK